jgi:hypothetical protein
MIDNGVVEEIQNCFSLIPLSTSSALVEQTENIHLRQRLPKTSMRRH